MLWAGPEPTSKPDPLTGMSHPGRPEPATWSEPSSHHLALCLSRRGCANPSAITHLPPDRACGACPALSCGSTGGSAQERVGGQTLAAVNHLAW